VATVFFSYTHVDEALRDQLEIHLAGLKRQGVIETWHDRRIAAGSHIDRTISRELEAADAILLLVSANFIASDYCYNREMRRALERHEAGDAQVIPVILRRCDWHGTPFGKLMATPKDGKPITTFPDLDEGFMQVVEALKGALASMKATRSPQQAPAAPHSLVVAAPGPRSSNLRLPKTFTEADVDQFREDAFDFMAKFFENSLQELRARNDGVETRFKRVDAHKFSAVAYIGGKMRAYCHIAMEQSPRGIAYSSSENMGAGSFNESLFIESDEEGIFMRPLGFATHGERSSRLTFQGGAEFYWDMFMKAMRW
jgi:hypothetical protein